MAQNLSLTNLEISLDQSCAYGYRGSRLRDIDDNVDITLYGRLRRLEPYKAS